MFVSAAGRARGGRRRGLARLRRSLFASQFILPRLTLRARLTLLYGGFFFGMGVALVAAIELFLPQIPLRSHSSSSASQAAPYGQAPGAPTTGTTGSSGDPGELFSYAGHGINLESVVFLAVMVLVSLAIGWFIAGRLLRPLRTITATAREICAGDLDRRLALDGPHDEIRELGETLDGLFGRLGASFRSQRHFVANASHELRTPLTAERTLLQVALADPDATVESLRSTCRELLSLGEQQGRLIEALLTLADSERDIEHWESLDLAGTAAAIVADRRPETDLRRIAVAATLGPAPATGDPSLIRSLVANLVDNAIRHNDDGGRIEIATSTQSGFAVIAVRNTGAPVPPAEIDRLFQPFQRLGTERVGNVGHGLGLAIVRAIAGVHDATVTAVPRPGGGLDIEVRFP
ncbi:MAG TPA: HAMP domain-containing sensor histidine kinase [Actinocrinis sp.]